MFGYFRRRLSYLAPAHVFYSLATLAGIGALYLGGPLHPAVAPKSSAVSVASTSVVLERSFWSASLGREMPFAVYLPPHYSASPKTRYPVLYMLHGLGGNHDDWQNDGLFSAATRLINAGEIPPMIIVTPDGESGYWVDHANNGPRFGTYVAGDLVSLIDSQYRTIPSRGERAIGGMSMGGHGALQLALTHPSEFGIVGAHSVALRRKDQAFDFFGDQQYFEAHDPVSIVAKSPALADRFTISIDIGTSDPWYPAALAFHNELEAQGVPHAWQTGPGGHDGDYWSTHVVDYLRFYGRSFQASDSLALLAH